MVQWAAQNTHCELMSEPPQKGRYLAVCVCFFSTAACHGNSLIRVPVPPMILVWNRRQVQIDLNASKGFYVCQSYVRYLSFIIHERRARKYVDMYQSAFSERNTKIIYKASLRRPRVAIQFSGQTLGSTRLRVALLAIWKSIAWPQFPMNVVHTNEQVSR